MRQSKQSILCLPILAFFLLLNDSRAAHATNDDRKPDVRRLGSSLTKTKSEYKSKPTKIIKGADDRQLLWELIWQENPPQRKRQPAFSKNNLRFPHEEKWKEQFKTPSPTTTPSTTPSQSPSALPSTAPSQSPSALPSNAPSESPSELPSNAPSEFPSLAPTLSPTATVNPSNAPSESPSTLPSTPPSESPSSSPTTTPLRVACAGDSLTRGTSGVSNGVSYPHQLQRLLGGGFETRNYGRNAMTAIADLDVSYIKTSQYRDSLAFDADIYLLMLGTNDSIQWGPHSHKYQAGLKFIIDQVRNTSPGVRIILAIPPWAKTNTYGVQNSILANDIQPKIRQVALAQQVELVDMYKATFSRDDLYTSDNLHLNAEGYRTLAQVWERQIVCNKNGICDIGESCETCRVDCLEQCGGRNSEKEIRNDVPVTP
ncbi:MAG: hypothetical protein SGBAC_008316 [Bacillariaceae sp.]